MAEALVAEYLVISSSLPQFVYFSNILRERNKTKTKYSAPKCLKKTSPSPAPNDFTLKVNPMLIGLSKCSCSSRVMRGSQCLAEPWNIEYLRCISKHVWLKFVIVHKQQHIAFNKALGSWIELMKLANKSQLRWFWEKEVLLLLWLWRRWFSLYKQ